MMSRVLLLIVTIFTYLMITMAAPIPEPVDLERRITHAGRGTWFHVGLGNCGQHNVDSDLIVAIPKSLYDQNSASNCNQWVKITNTATGKTAYGLTRDSCPSCGWGDLEDGRRRRTDYMVAVIIRGAAGLRALTKESVVSSGSRSDYCRRLW
ncbi:hypothetical protein NP233_g951 [Leucocoprinus birnbaumii]|uniref:Riboflavin aldehyde-forming enzyme n=1 Tax=Leucocoprinus birnbaumii TaxID=56174 RepID=A0AAD5W0Y3_9AGAR|nr:hypothetical protein NP233_g951 [Leucocoprinus birnbaumii]